MNDDNPFRAPTAALSDGPPLAGLELAGRAHRLGAVMLDGFISSLLMVPAGIAIGYFSFTQGKKPQPLLMGIEMAILGFVVFAIVQSYFLKKNGQTIGKKIVGVRIVDLNGQVPSLTTLLGRRYAPMLLIGAVPIIGPLAGLVDDLFIFRQDRRCVHDFIAGTKVVQCGQRLSAIIWILLPFVLLFVIGVGAAILVPMFAHPKPIRHIPVTMHKPLPKTSQVAPPAIPTAHVIPANHRTPEPVAHAPVPVQEKAQASAAMPAPTASKPATHTDLRNCLNLKDNEAIIRCSEQSR